MLWLVCSLLAVSVAAPATAADARLRTVVYDANAVVTVPVRRGVVTHVLLGEDEVLQQLAAGQGGDCSKPEALWCITAQAGDRSIFVKPKAGAAVPNNVAVVSDRRTHAFRFVVLADQDRREPVYRLLVTPPASISPSRAGSASAQAAPPPLSDPPSDAERLQERLSAAPEVVNTSYSIAEGRGSSDIVPTLVFDDGRFTYFRFPGNREVPAVFHVLGDGSETLVNSRMEGELLVVDRVSRLLKLRAGSAVVGVWNDAFDLDGHPPVDGTTVPGVARVLKSPGEPTREPETGERP
nr:TrbG/VirB9 family P-type conjugative transfer protein [Rubrivivax gelatinosus]